MKTRRDEGRQRQGRSGEKGQGRVAATRAAKSPRRRREENQPRLEEKSWSLGVSGHDNNNNKLQQRADLRSWTTSLESSLAGKLA